MATAPITLENESQFGINDSLLSGLNNPLANVFMVFFIVSIKSLQRSIYFNTTFDISKLVGYVKYCIIM